MVQGGQVMPPIALECPLVGCHFGEGGGRYKTPPLPSGEAIQVLTLHTHSHVQTQGVAVVHGTGGATVGCKVEKVPRPVLRKGQSENKFLHLSFSRQCHSFTNGSLF